VRVMSTRWLAHGTGWRGGRAAATLALALVGGCGDDATDGGGGAGASAACAAYADQEGEVSVTIRFTNQSGLPLYLPATCGELRYSIEPAAGDDGSDYAYSRSCLTTCEDLFTSGTKQCGACAATSLLLPAGESVEVEWDGTRLERNVTMPQSCFALPDEEGPECSRRSTAPDGTYRPSVVAYGSCGAECTCDPSGVCMGIVEGAEALPEPTTFDFPSDREVEVVFGACALPCP
jgi:hypothetical protein